MKLRYSLKIVLLLLAIMLVACSGSADPTAAPTEPTEIPTQAPESTDEPEPTAVSETTDEPEEEDSADAFPVTIEHKYGSTEIPEQPQRVVSVGYSEQDELLALGVVPVGLRYWYGPYENGVWPWAQDQLGDAQLEIIASDVINFEAIAELNPDLIVGITSGMTQEEYDSLSAIAPTLAQSGDYVDYGVPWQEVMRVLGQATGNSAAAEEIVTDLEDRFADIRASHPQFDGATMAVAFSFNGLPGVYASQDGRPRLLAELGFVTPELYDEVAGDAFYLTFSEEELPEFLDVDTVVWLAGSDEGIELIQNHPLRPTLRVAQEGRELFLGELLGGAFSFSSPLSLNFLLDEMVPMLEAAVDGDPETIVPGASGAMPVPDVADDTEEMVDAGDCADGQRQVSHALLDAPICVPDNPQNVVAIDLAALELMLMLGLEPAARPNAGFLQAIYGSETQLANRITELVTDLPDFGSLFEPNVEILAEIEPDLIISYQTLPNLDQLAEIAPLITSPYPAQPEGWSEVTELYAEVLGVRAEYDQLVAEYAERIAAFEAARLPEYDGASLVYLQNQGELNYVGPPGLAVWETLGDAGFVPVATLPQSLDEAIADYGGPVFVLSEEQIALADADVIILANGGVTPEQNDASDAIIESYRNDPLWGNLRALQSGDFYPSSIYWQSNGLVSVHAVIDDLFRYFGDVDSAEVAPNPFFDEE